MLEGYGITECSPVVSVNRPGTREARHGRRAAAGRRGVRHRPGDEGGAAAREDGDAARRGADRLPRLPRARGPPPFEEIDGKQWYVTGDLAELDATGAIVFHGRLKRFLKAGGEMISLPALEEPFAKKYPPTDEGPRVAVEGIETPDGRRIVLFTTEADHAARRERAACSRRASAA